MRTSGFAILSTLCSSVVASPVDLYLNARAVSVTAAEVSKFDFYAQYAGAAYCNSENAAGTAITCTENACPDVQAAGAKTVASVGGEVTDNQGFIATDSKNKLIVLSFRGSHSIRNWITNLVFAQTSCDLVSGCLIHTGFLTAWNEVASEVTAAIQTAKAANPSYTIIATGHSLGGAVATIAAGYLRKSGYAVDLWTYGSPRVGNAAFVDFVTAQAGAEYRATHTDDPVPRLPPILFNYRHTSPEYWLKTGNETTTYMTSDIQVCEGNANIKCNGGTLGLDVDAHRAYFQDISACSPDGTPLKKRDEETVGEGISDEDLEARLNAWVAADVAAVKNGEVKH